MKFILIILLILSLVLLIGAIFWIFLGLPIWMVVHCATSKRSSLSKTVWIILMFFGWPVVALIYGLFASRRRAIQAATAAAAGFLLLFLSIAIFASAGQQRRFDRQLQGALGRLDTLTDAAVSSEQRQQLRAALETLQREPEQSSSGISRLWRFAGSQPFYELFFVYAEDGLLTEEEVSDWLEKFRSRELIDRQALRQHIRQLGRRNTTN